MKRILQYKKENDRYVCSESGHIVFEIQKSDLQFNVQNFYQAFYGEGMNYDDIIINNESNDDKEATRIYECIISLIEKINDKLVKNKDGDDTTKEEISDNGIHNSISK